MKFKIFAFLLVLVYPFVNLNAQQVENAEEAYTRVITERADKIVEVMSFENDTLKIRVRDLIVEHYRFLNQAEEARNADVAIIREELAANKELRDAKIDLRKAEQELNIRDHHFEFISQLKFLLPDEKIDQIKDGLTYNVLTVTYDSYCDMIPSMTQEEKDQLMMWMLEAREHAIDGGSSKEKHNWFGKYKGRMNNYLSKRGYDIQQERKNWEERLKKQGVKL